MRDIGDARLEIAEAASGEEYDFEGAPRPRATLPWALAAVSLLTLAGVVTGNPDTKGKEWAAQYGFPEDAIYTYDTVDKFTLSFIARF